MSVPEQQAMSVEAFLIWSERQEGRYELVDGAAIRMMAGAKQSHAVVVSNILVALVPQARRGGCRTTASDMAVRTGPASIRYPDVVVDCGPPDPSTREASHPTVLIEVSSPRTSAIDVTDKLEEYQRLETVRVILFVDPDVVSVKVYRRMANGAWAVERLNELAQAVHLPEIGAVLTLADVYVMLEPEQRPSLRVVAEADPGA